MRCSADISTPLGDLTDRAVRFDALAQGHILARLKAVSIALAAVPAAMTTKFPEQSFIFCFGLLTARDKNKVLTHRLLLHRGGAHQFVDLLRNTIGVTAFPTHPLAGAIGACRKIVHPCEALLRRNYFRHVAERFKVLGLPKNS
jgi:hypothetical protein